MEKPTDDLKQLRETLQSAGLRMNQQRIEVYREVKKPEEHPSAPEVYSAVKERMPSISLDTVYRTLWKLSELGLLSPITCTGEGVRFDCFEQRHHHFICARCGRTYDFESERLDRIGVPKEAKGLGEPWEVHVRVRGLCNQCRKQAGKDK
jgi:Fur family peroxide stress response transcriptional regulator